MKVLQGNRSRPLRGVSLLVLLLSLSVLLIVGCQSAEPEATPTPEPSATPIPEPSATAVPPTSAPPAATAVTEDGSTDTPIAGPEQIAALQNVNWVLVTYGDPANPIVIEESTVVTALFREDGTVTGSGGCNNYQASYEVSADGALTVGPVATTQAACPQGMELEAGYLQALAASERFEFSERGRLQITYAAIEGITGGVMTFVPGETPLTDTNWVLLSYGDPGAPTLVQQGTATTARLVAAESNETGTITGFGGCNQYQAQYTLSGENIAFTPPISTRMACALGTEQETAFLDALATAQSYRIVGARLEINYNGGVLTLSARSLPLTDVLWTLTAVAGGPTPDNTPIVALFTQDENSGSGEVSGYAGCQTYRAEYTMNGETLSVTSPQITGQLCAETFDFEQRFFDALSGATNYRVYGEQLGLQTPEGLLAFSAFRAPLERVTWQLAAIGLAADPEPVAEEAAYTITFIRSPDAPSGVALGETACSTYHATFAASLDEIRVNLPVPAPVTECTPAALQQQQRYFAFLNEAASYRILGNNLQLIADDGETLTFTVATEPAAEEPAPGPDLSPLDGTTWYLASLIDQTVLPGTGISAQFAVNADGVTGSISGSAGCNSYSTAIDAGFVLGPIATTRQTCASPAGIMEQEQQYLAALATATDFSLLNNQLLLLTPGGVLVYSATPPRPPVDQTAQLQSAPWYLVNYGGIAAVPNPETSIRFNPDNTVVGNTGCNGFNGTYRTDGPRLWVESLASTQAACAAPLDQQEAYVMATLGSAHSYQIEASQLQVFGDAGVLTYSSVPPGGDQGTLVPVVVAPTSARVGEVVTFDATTTQHSLPIIKFVWFFGDGAQAFGPVVQHAYSSAGTFVITLTVADNRGTEVQTTQQIQITE